MTPASMAFLESFFAWRFAGSADIRELWAREAEAFVILEKEWRAEQANGH